MLCISPFLSNIVIGSVFFSFCIVYLSFFKLETSSYDELDFVKSKLLTVMT